MESAKPEHDSKGKHDEKGKGSEYVQVAGQEASNYQSADADAVAFQVKPNNEALAIRVLSPGDDGDVTQSNSAKTVGAALNDNETKQSLDQTQTGTSAAVLGGSDEEGRREGLRLHADRGAECIEPPGRRRGCDGGSGEAEQRGLLDPRPQPG